MTDGLLSAVLLYVLAGVWIAGGLLVWPLYRHWRRSQTKTKTLGILRWIFVLHCMGLAVGMLSMLAIYANSNADAQMSSIFLYGVGGISLLASACVIGIDAICHKRDAVLAEDRQTPPPTP